VQSLEEVDPVLQGVFDQGGDAKATVSGAAQDMVENAK
jgi:hypothetical protein